MYGVDLEEKYWSDILLQVVYINKTFACKFQI